MPKAFTARFSDLSGPTNPTGILSPAFLALKMALEHGDNPENVLQALYDWLSQKGVEPSQVDRILDLPSPEHAYEALVQLIGGKLKGGSLPVVVKSALMNAIKLVAKRHVERGAAELDQQQSRLQGLRGRYGLESAPQIVRLLLSS